MAKKSKLAVTGLSVTGNLLNHTPGRRAAILRLSRYGFQANHTPYELAAQMLPPAADRVGKSILVIFNLEFLEVLSTDGQDMSLVTFIADTAAERRFARLIYGVQTKLAGKHSWERALGHKKQNELIRRLIMGKHSMGAAADITFSNPPYNGGIDLKIILAMNEAKLLKRLICVHPSTWLMDVKTQLSATSGNATFRKFQDAVKDHVTQVELFNGNKVFNIETHVPTAIIDYSFDKANSGCVPTLFIGEDEPYNTNGIHDITLHGKHWDPLIKDFFNKVKGKINTMKSIKDFRLKSWSKSDKDALQLSPMVGHGGVGYAFKNRSGEDFYCLMPQGSTQVLGVRTEDPRFHTFKFNTSKEMTNFCNYLRTDFVRLCFSLLKNAQDAGPTEISLIPWIDFTRSWDDDQLFTMMGYHKGHPIREYAKTFLPDYHNLYPNGKTY